MNTYQKIANDVVEYNRTFEKFRKEIQNKICLREKQIERLRKKENKLRKSYVYWTKNFLEPLVSELHKHFPEYPNMEILGPFGLRSACSIWFFKKKRDEIEYKKFFERDNLISITIIPIDIDEGVYEYETSEVIDKYAKNTIGDVNGANNVTKEIESIEELVDHLKKQYELIN